MRRRILRFLNKTLTSPLCFLISLADGVIHGFNNERGRKRNYRKILAIKIAGMGDAILMLPALKMLKDKFPNASISVLATPATKVIFEGDTTFDEVIVYDILSKDAGIIKFIKFIELLRKKKFDLVIDMEQYIVFTTILGYLTGAKERIGFDKGKTYNLLTRKIPFNRNQHMTENFADLVRCTGINIPIKHLERVWFSEEDKENIDKLLLQKGINDEQFLIGIHATSHKEIDCRRWMKERFAIVADNLIRDYKAKVIFTGGPTESDKVAEIVDLMKEKPISVAGKTSVKELIALVDKLDLVLCNDTGISHIAAAMNTRAVVLFGPESPRRYRPFGDIHIPIYKNVDCSPCIHVHLGDISFNSCPDKEHPKCMDLITVGEVMDAMDKQIEEIKKRKGGFLMVKSSMFKRNRIQQHKELSQKVKNMEVIALRS